MVVGTIGSDHLKLFAANAEQWEIDDTNGDLNGAAGNTIAIEEGTAASACSGTATINGTTAVTVSTTCAATGSRILLTRTSDSTVASAILWTTNIVDGTSFDIDSSEATDDGTVNWFIIHEAP